MARKKSSRRKHTAPREVIQPADAPLDPGMIAPPSPLLAERSIRKLTRYMEESDFASIDEADRHMQEMLASDELRAILDAPPETPLEEAQDLMCEAWVAPTPARRRRLAKRALAISPDCADAYTLLGELTQNPHDARQFYEQGIQAAERVLGPEFLAENAGYLWNLVEARPYMRARLGLAQVLWFSGERQQAIEHGHELLRLNVNDNQGVRYELINWLLATGANDDAQQLLNQYKEDISANWAYSRAFLAFRKKPKGRAARMARLKALDTNPFVPGYLLGLFPLPPVPPEFMEFGEDSEAVAYMFLSAQLWDENPEALDWLAEPVEELYTHVLTSSYR